MGWATRRSPVGSAPIRVWAVGKRPAWALVGLEALFPWPGRGEEMGIESDFGALNPPDRSSLLRFSAKAAVSNFDAASFNPGMQITLRRLRVIYIP